MHTLCNNVPAPDVACITLICKINEVLNNAHYALYRSMGKQLSNNRAYTK